VNRKKTLKHTKENAELQRRSMHRATTKITRKLIPTGNFAGDCAFYSILKGSPMFDNIGGGEILLILIVVLIFFGPKKIPELAQGLGKGIREFRKATKGIQDAVEKEVSEVKEIGHIHEVNEIKDVGKTLTKPPLT
jgi:sec-independent protein translocase protein TatA